MRTPIVFAALLTPTLAALYESVADLPTLEYDYVIVGGGTAGNVLANRLTESAHVSVLVLEAGASNADVTASIIPLFGPSLAPGTPYDWNYTTVPQVGFNGRTIPYSRGRILGGSSSINYMVYNRGSRDDFDYYARISGSLKWSWDAVQGAIRKNEKYVEPNDGHDTTGQYLPSAHSRTGMVSVSLPGYAVPMESRVIATTKEFPEEFPYQTDMNAGDTIGVGWTQATVGDGQRSSSATAYLAPKYLARPNLSVLLHAQATKVVQTGTSKGLPVFGAVEFARSATSTRIQVKARKEVILSAGSFNSPHILMLSGIGDRTELTAAGIETIVDLPSVGKNMTDHVLLAPYYYVKSNDTYQDHLTPDVINEEITTWSQTHKGPLSYTCSNLLAWLRLPKNDKIFDQYPDPTPGPTSAHYELIFANGFIGPAPPPGQLNTIVTNLISPMSRGTVALKSSNPFDPPVIDPQLLNHPFDVHTIVAAVKAAQKFLTAKAWKDYIVAPYGGIAGANTDVEIESYARANAGTVYHAVGTASMSPKGASWGVVDPDLRVKGTVGLRVVDASVIPYVPTAHTQGPVYIFAEVAADIIKAEASAWSGAVPRAHGHMDEL